MAQFSYSAQNESGKMMEGTLEAANEMDAIVKLQQKGLLVLNVREVKGLALSGVSAGSPKETAPSVSMPEPKTKKGSGFSFLLLGEKVPASDLIFLAEQMALLIKGGIPLLQGLKMLAQNVTSPLLRRTLDTVAEDVSGGSNLSVALSKHPRVFEDLWIAMVEAGEASGNLVKALEDVSSYLNQRDILKSKVITAFMYPSILMLVSIFVLIFFMIKIVPVFSQIFTSFNMKLPPMTIAVISISNVLRTNAILIIGAVSGLVFSWKAYVKTTAGQLTKAQLSLSMPVFGNFIRNIMLEKFLVNFALLLRSGVDIIKTLQILEKLLGSNRIYFNAVVAARESIKGGGTITAGLSQAKIFPNIIIQMAQMGEESGKLPEIMETLAIYYRRQIDTFISRLSAVIDPIMVLGVGAIVTVIVLAVFTPIFELTQIGASKGG